MSDIVKVLRAIDHMSVEDCFLQSPMFEKAAAEIERLKKEALFTADTVLPDKDAEIERLRAALREHACECVCVCMNAKVNYGEIDTPDTCKYGRARAVLAQEKHDG